MTQKRYLFISYVLVSITLPLLSSNTQYTPKDEPIPVLDLNLNETVSPLKKWDIPKEKLQNVDAAIKAGKIPTADTLQLYYATSEGFNEFCSLLKKSPDCKPTVITFEYCDLKKCRLSPLTEAITAHAFSLTILNFFRSELPEDHMQEIAKIVAFSAQLKNLTVSDAKIPSIKPLTDVIAQHSSITYLCLADNCLAGENIKEIGNALAQNTTLKKLILMNNKMDNDAFSGLAHGIALNTSLTQLDISLNKITMQGIQNNLDMFRKNKTLKEIYFIDNNLGKGDYTTWAQALTHNKSLQKLYLQRCWISKENEKILKEILKKEIPHIVIAMG